MGPGETVSSRDAAPEPTRMYSRRVSEGPVGPVLTPRCRIVRNTYLVVGQEPRMSRPSYRNFDCDGAWAPRQALHHNADTVCHRGVPGE